MKRHFDFVENLSIQLTPPKISCHQDQSEDKINILLPELLAKIFEYLDHRQRLRVEQVCKRWQSIAFKNSWTNDKQLTLDITDPEIFRRFKILLRRCGKFLKELLVVGNDYQVYRLKFYTIFPPEVIRMMPNLVHLHFVKVYLDQHDSEKIVRHFPNLRSLSTRSPKNIDDLVGGLPHLECLRIPPILITPQLLNTMPQNLHILDLCWVKDRFQNSLSKRICISELLDFARFPNLEVLGICFTQRDMAGFAGALKAVTRCPLRALSVWKVDDQGIVAIANKCPALEYLSIELPITGGFYTGRQICVKSLSALAELANLSNLKTLDFRRLFSRELRSGNLEAFFHSLEAIVERGKLENLFCSNVSFTAQFLAGLLRKCKSLKLVDCCLHQIVGDMDEIIAALKGSENEQKNESEDWPKRVLYLVRYPDSPTVFSEHPLIKFVDRDGPLAGSILHNICAKNMREVPFYLDLST